ncbi:MAG: hypothetical protein KC505_00990 [Myxococcales bacterium]|nr:hypothetical protein [Myxococcales bacterium]USN50330.1 MAG: hypothetical protein H6731_08695 [Myxococcales bacterium]
MFDTLVISFYVSAVLISGLRNNFRIREVEVKESLPGNLTSTFVTVATIFATFIGGGATLGVIERIYSCGLVFLYVCLAFIVRDILTAYFIVPRIHNLSRYSTVGDIAANFYGKTGKLLTGLAGVLQASMYLAMQIAALGHILNYFTEIPYSLGVIVTSVIVMLYATGARIKIAKTSDIIQFGVLVIVIPVTFTIGVEMVGGFYGLLSSLPTQKLSLIPETNEQIRWLGVAFVFCLPNMPPALNIRFLMGKDAAQLKKSLLISALMRVPYFFMIGVLGLIVLVLEPSIESDTAFIYLINKTLPWGVQTLVIASLIAVILSTAQYLLVVVQKLLSQDILLSCYENKLSQAKEYRISFWVMAALGIVAMGAALSVINIIELCILSYACWLPCIAIPLIANILGMHVSKSGFIASASSGFGVFLISKLFFYETLWIDSIVLGTATNFFVYSFYYFIERKNQFKERASHGVATVRSKSFFQLVPFVIKYGATHIHQGFFYLVERSAQKVEVFGAPYAMFVLFSIANLCFVPFIFADTSGEVTQKFIVYLRVIASIFSFILVVKDFWARRFLKYLPLYWHVTLFFCLPYFAITMCLFTSCAIEWVIDLVLTIFILGILVDWKTYIYTIILGALFAALSFAMFGDLRQFEINIGNFPIMAYAVAVSVCAGALFSRNKELVLMEKLITFKALGGTIAHEMRTPLSSIQVSANGLKNLLPVLVDGYLQARNAGLRVEKIPQMALESVASIPERMRYICASSLNIIDMLLLQLKDNDWNAHFSVCSMKECIDIALNEYCFRENERSLVDINGIEDFNFYGNRYLVVHILYNLMRNAFTFIQSEKKGSIIMWTSESPTERNLHFCDTAKGICEADLPHVFEHGFSKRSGGSGVGLHYCRKMMTTMSGRITVNSQEGKYCEFILSFSKVD